MTEQQRLSKNSRLHDTLSQKLPTKSSSKTSHFRTSLRHFHKETQIWTGIIRSTGRGTIVLHSTIGKIQKRTHAMKNEASQLKTTMHVHLLQTSQQVQSLIPPKRKKKSNKKHY